MDPNIPAPCDIYIEVEIGVNCLLSLSLSSAGEPEQDPYVDGDLLRSCSEMLGLCSGNPDQTDAGREKVISEATYGSLPKSPYRRQSCFHLWLSRRGARIDWR
jgi:hypothetical protein